MACPYFYPVKIHDENSWTRPPRLPLIDLYTGCCCAVPPEDWKPSEHSLREHCNFGYAQGCCTRIPNGATADAIRFSVAQNSCSRDSTTLKITYIIEKNHAPVEFGGLEYSIASGVLTHTHADHVLARQAEAFAESYLRATAG